MIDRNRFGKRPVDAIRITGIKNMVCQRDIVLDRGFLNIQPGFNRPLDIANSNQESLSDRLELALEGRRRWLGERLQGDWTNEMGKPDPNQYPSFMERLVGIRKPSDQEK